MFQKQKGIKDYYELITSMRKKKFLDEKYISPIKTIFDEREKWLYEKNDDYLSAMEEYKELYKK